MVLKLEPGVRLVAATHNAGKAVEIAALLEGRFETVTAGSLGLPEPEETEATFVGNAVLKARQAADLSGRVAIADDSGLCVDGLAGDPGVLSARWAGEPRDFGRAMARVEAELREAGGGDVADDGARFVCALAVAWPNAAVVAVEGTVEGRLVFPGRGTLGFGYDPIFKPEGAKATFGEMDAARKHVFSHRTRAFEKLKAALF